MTTPDALLCKAFVVPAAGYDALMGRYLVELGPAFSDLAGVQAGQRVLDVGCGPGGLTSELVARVGAPLVAAIDPSPPFVEACRDRNPGADVRVGMAEELPFPNDRFDATLASLVVGFMRDPRQGIREMARVTRAGGVVACCFWSSSGMPAIQAFWRSAAALDPSVPADPARLGAGEGELSQLLREAGLHDIRDGVIHAGARYADFADFWHPFEVGVGPAGQYVAALDPHRQARLRAACHERLGAPTGPFRLEAVARYAVAAV